MKIQLEGAVAMRVDWPIGFRFPVEGDFIQLHDGKAYLRVERVLFPMWGSKVVRVEVR